MMASFFLRHLLALGLGSRRMPIYFTVRRSPTESFMVIFDSGGLERAKRYKQSLISDGSYREDQVTIAGTDADGEAVDA